MSTCNVIRQPPVRNLQETPALRIVRLRRAMPELFRGSAKEVRIDLESGSRGQSLVLVPDPRPFGPRYLAVCGCGRRTPVLRLDVDTGLWRCWKCCNLRSVYNRFRNTTAFRIAVRPLLDLQRILRRLRPRARRARRAEFEKQEAEVLEQIGDRIRRLTRKLPPDPCTVRPESGDARCPPPTHPAPGGSADGILDAVRRATSSRLRRPPGRRTSSRR